MVAAAVVDAVFLRALTSGSGNYLSCGGPGRY